MTLWKYKTYQMSLRRRRRNTQCFPGNICPEVVRHIEMYMCIVKVPVGPTLTKQSTSSIFYYSNSLSPIYLEYRTYPWNINRRIHFQYSDGNSFTDDSFRLTEYDAHCNTAVWAALISGGPLILAVNSCC